ncbi:hypothetical protein KAH43_02685 [Candidatus Bipolaricaulota bacterium]|nr:hypothetical protein [Candidatus Bipolaricaulota bacterium]
MEHSIAALQLAFLLQEERLGRRRLADRTGLSEMTVRLELEQLRSRGLVQLDRQGCELTDEGLRLFSPVLKLVVKVLPVELSGLRIDVFNLAAQLRGIAPIPAAWKLRDEAIREGASGLIMLREQEGEWTFSHDQEPIRVQYVNDAERLDQSFQKANLNDFMLIVSGPNRNACTRGLWRAIWVLAMPPR